MKSYFLWLVWVVIYLSISSTIGQVTQSSAEIELWYQGLMKSFLTPPDYVFPIAWSFLYVLIATAGWNTWHNDADKDVKILFLLYTIFNWSWSFVFFEAQEINVAFGWILMVNFLNIYFMIKAWKPARWASFAMILPLLWTCFAAYLNFEIWRLN